MSQNHFSISNITWHLIKIIIIVTCNRQNLRTQIHFSKRYPGSFQTYERIFQHPALALCGSSRQGKHAYSFSGITLDDTVQRTSTPNLRVGDIIFSFSKKTNIYKLIHQFETLKKIPQEGRCC